MNFWLLKFLQFAFQQSQKTRRDIKRNSEVVLPCPLKFGAGRYNNRTKEEEQNEDNRWEESHKNKNESKTERSKEESLRRLLTPANEVMFSVVSVSLSVVTTADLFELVHLGTPSPPPLGLLFTCCQYINWSMSSWPLTERPFFLSPTNEVWGKVMFSQMFVCPQGGGGHPDGNLPRTESPLPDRYPPVR